MNGTEEDSFGFPEFLEKENCLPASNSSTTSSVFGNFERQQNELNVNWKEVLLEKAKIAKIRCRLQSDEYKAKAGKTSDRVKELELELIHAQIKKLEGEVNAIAKSSKEGNTKINGFSEILDSSESEDSCSQFVDEPLKLVPSNTCSTFDDTDTSLNERFELPLEMVYMFHKFTERGVEFFFTDGKEKLVVTELRGCNDPFCLLYEYLNKSICGDEYSDKSKSKKFRWTCRLPRYNLVDKIVNMIEAFFFH
ncbi:unnamed protein product [Meloidogyne enterolobii]|uniref:Uncharacterized protein n=1 Tax=Meloidogyne enterolobii TaxID=390850 RepID=A0ACB0YAQ2_MELEN